jgi:hypothetical protein
MVKLNAHYDGKTIVPDEPVSFAPNQKLRITVEPVDSTAPHADRVPGLQRESLVWISPDFDEHLGDEFWGLKDAQ